MSESNRDAQDPDDDGEVEGAREGADHDLQEHHLRRASEVVGARRRSGFLAE